MNQILSRPPEKIEEYLWAGLNRIVRLHIKFRVENLLHTDVKFRFLNVYVTEQCFIKK